MKMGKVYESAKDMTHYIPLKTLETVEKLPSKELFEKCLKKLTKYPSAICLRLIHLIDMNTLKQI